MHQRGSLASQLSVSTMSSNGVIMGTRVGLTSLIAAICLASGLAAAESPAVRQVNNSSDGAASNPLLDQIDSAIETTSRRYLLAESHTPWQILHGILALRQDFMIKRNGEKIAALDWVSDGASYKGTPYFRKSRWGGEAQPFTKPYIFQGHPCQFLAILTMSKLPKEHEFRFEGQSITINDLINHAKAEVNADEEITWVLWALGHYLPSDAVWRNSRGETWSIERLVQIQTRANVYDAACGGTHGLFALAVARNNYVAEGKQLRGTWMEADQKIKRYAETARYYQNTDGSFSNSHFQGRSYSYDFNTRIASSGHQLEFLMMALPQKRLSEDWVRKALAATAKDLLDHKSAPADCGPLYHGLSALVIYRDRVAPNRGSVTKKTDTEKTDSDKNKPDVKKSDPAQGTEKPKVDTEKPKTEPKSDAADKKPSDSDTKAVDKSEDVKPDSSAVKTESANDSTKAEDKNKSESTAPKEEQIPSANVEAPLESKPLKSQKTESPKKIETETSVEFPRAPVKKSRVVPIIAEVAILAGAGLDIGDAKPADATLDAPPAPSRVPAVTDEKVPTPIDD